MPSTQFLGHFIVWAFGPGKPRGIDRKIIEIGHALLPKTVHVILVLVSNNDEVEVVTSCSFDAIDHILKDGEAEILSVRSGFETAVDQHIDGLTIAPVKCEKKAIAVARLQGITRRAE